MSKTDPIHDHLVSRFEQHRLVVWRDPDGSYATAVETQAPTGVTVLRVENDEFGIKHRVLRDEPGTKFLLYRNGSVPEGTENWLLDLELAHGVFTADRSALMQTDLGLTAPGTDVLIAEHSGFFGEIKLVAKFKALLSPQNDLPTVKAKMCAVALGQKEHSFSELTRTLLVQHAASDNSGYQSLVTQGLADFYWDGAAAIYGYESESPSVAGFVLWMFKQARDGFEATSSSAARNVEIDFRSFRDSMRSADALKKLARKAEIDLDFAEQANGASLSELARNDIFDAGEQEIIRHLIEGIRSQTLASRDVAEMIRTRRRDSVWFGDYSILYSALGAAAELLPAIRSARLDLSGFDDGLIHYRDDLFRIDQLYRQYTLASQTAEFTQPLEALNELVENAYVTDFLSKLGVSWQQQVDHVEKWKTPAITSQSSFYDHYIAPLLHGGRKKAVVIISDALRYEVAEELTSKIRGENKYDAKIEATLGVLPSYTQLGMAALLPHRTLAHSEDGDPVLADGLLSNGTANRSKILAAVGGTAIQATGFLKMKPAERRDLYAANQVLYVYHDTIDATGDKAVSEHRTFKAASDAIDEIIDIVKKLASANATNIFVTADHGFLYQESRLAPQFNLTVKPQGDKLVVENRRYVLGRGLKQNNAFRLFTPEQVGLSSDLEVQIPNSICRIVKPGAGFQFVHGGASLQEIVVPVISINKGRSDTVELVNVDIHPESDKITTGQIVVKLYQQSAVTDQRTARKLRAGLYFGEQLISNESELLFDAESTEGRDRFQSVRLLLSKEADAANNHSVEFRLSEPIGETGEWKKYKSVPYTLKRSFTTDFDF
ncbi:BREX-1 system phosphatase PglZ type A [Salinibacterium sp. SWN1162]|uniref:BREX-1 system phosphatase PglZ type A n=1 Tax=Salinibacterium sp. SWN1162 TaxID=2792053 RepID=UPI0018CEF01A|nr:BREX-1 system phosphatase PglZ type A [Salinibacterium sp. SWN1162]MBH0009575.1 BREX-1 system phosphatase PglZ type A [Salinibacterium sp. SWN1162]